MATVTAAPTPARTAATATLVTAPAIARIPTVTAAIIGATTAATADTTGVTADITAAITINSERDQGHRVAPRLAPRLPAHHRRRHLAAQRWNALNDRSHSTCGSNSDVLAAHPPTTAMPKVPRLGSSYPRMLTPTRASQITVTDHNCRAYSRLIHAASSSMPATPSVPCQIS